MNSVFSKRVLPDSHHPISELILKDFNLQPSKALESKLNGFELDRFDQPINQKNPIVNRNGLCL